TQPKPEGIRADIGNPVRDGVVRLKPPAVGPSAGCRPRRARSQNELLLNRVGYAISEVVVPRGNECSTFVDPLLACNACRLRAVHSVRFAPGKCGLLLRHPNSRLSTFDCGPDSFWPSVLR